MSLAAMGIGKLLTSVAVLGAAGFAGFNLMTTGCPLGTCEASSQSAVISTSLTSDDACSSCSISAALVSDTSEACSSNVSACSEMAESSDQADITEQTAAVQLVSETTEQAPCTGGSCDAEKAANCEGKGDCPHGDEDCTGQCPHQLVTSEKPDDNG